MTTSLPLPNERRQALGQLAAALALALALSFAPAVWAQPVEGAGSKQKATQAKQAPQPRLFATPEAARDALAAAGTAKDEAALEGIFGSDYEKMRSSDPVQHEQFIERFAARLQEAATLEQTGAGKYTLFVGAHHFPFPVPIVKDGDKWRFDSAAGLSEILNRRIGEDELSAIMVCKAFVLAQWEYFTQSGNHNEDGLAEYAQRFVSTPGKHDGLFWETGPGEDPSPLGPLIAAARAEGYGQAGRVEARLQPAKVGTEGAGKAAEERPRGPYHGYRLKILTRQGTFAPGGAFSYLINGHMIAGFALVAYPSEWGNTGVMTFIVNTQGRVYEKNLGPKTAEVALAMKEYNPDPSWKLAPKN